MYISLRSSNILNIYGSIVVGLFVDGSVPKHVAFEIN
jgi:hypothetical protein